MASESSWLIQLGETGDYDYSWSVVGIFYDPVHKALRVSEDSGCSCTSPWEYHELDDYGPPMSESDAYREFRNLCYESWTETEMTIAEVREKIRDEGLEITWK